MRVLLTGAGGFIGAHVARALLARGADVHAVVRDRSRAPRLGRIEAEANVTIHEADLLVRDHVRRVIDASSPETCVHAAWYAVPGKYLDATANLAHVAASLDLATRLAAAGCRRFVGVGTCFEYALADATAPLLESSPTGPRFLYATCKLALHEVLAAYAPTTKTSFAWCRVFYPYGPMEPPGRLVSHVVDRLLGDGVAETSEGAQIRDYMHVADVGAAIATVALSDAEGAVNVGSGVPTTVREIVATIARICNAQDRVHIGAVPYRHDDPMYVCADIQKLGRLGFEPRFDLESGLRDTVRARREELAVR
ncbi:MAG: NAD(P)-dependent oxidoreductase [Labilithrix sp.]|nr:NAD(P)-dependent oxidoreductase [Labilithrix sp.]